MLALLAYFADECALAKCTGDRQNSLEGVWTTGRATEAVQWSTFGVMGALLAWNLVSNLRRTTDTGWRDAGSCG